MKSHLQHNQTKLLRSLTTGKLPRNLSWNEVVELMGKLGGVQPREDNEVEFVVGAQRAFFKRPHSHSMEVDEVSRLRRFLHEAGVGPVPKQSAPADRIVAVIDHQTARIYQHLGGSEPESEDAIKPYDPHGFHRHLIHRKESHFAGQRVPEEASFYEQIAEDLKPAGEIVLIGHGTGKSSALDFLVEYLKTHHSTIVPRVIATEVTDLSALTEREIEAIAKQHIS
jgi:hypothetical protein